ncbi:MAG: type IV pilus twitching motility protein PilT [Planctomycetes bacterium]|nr:type IV pilus twitching motility protein PilT [Planctomycetota bacterium]
MIELQKLLDLVIKECASDLHLAVGRTATVRLHGALRGIGNHVLTPEDTAEAMKSITPERNLREFQESGSTDFAFSYGDKGRFRASILRQRGYVGIVLRLLPSQMMSLEEIGLPPVMKDVCGKPRGLVLVTGPTGSGKTTTLASMINHINDTYAHHMITVEDPIEYYHQHKKSIITQREVGVDVPTFAEAIRRGLRSDPDVMLVGEMRDLDTMGAAITAAETGHLVFGTLHTTGAANTVNRIVDSFPTDEKEQIRIQLAMVLEAVLSQTLIPTADGRSRVAAFEIMIVNDPIRHLIRENKAFRINSFIQTGGKQGMILLDDFLFGLWAQGRITLSEMLARAQDLESLQKKVREYTANSKRKR